MKSPYDCANISGEYHRDVDDFEWLCRRCHMVKDGRLEKLIRWNKRGKLLTVEQLKAGIKVITESPYFELLNK